MATLPIKFKLTTLIWCLALCCSVILVVFAYNMYPVPDGDAIGPIPAIKAYAMSGILENKLFLIESTIDPRGMGRYLAYPPGMPLFFGSLMSIYSAKSYQDVIILLSLARCASTFIFAKVVILMIRRRSYQSNLLGTLLVLLLIASNGFFLFASNGRSEILSILIVSIALLATLSIKPQLQRHGCIQICVALLFPVSIANGLIGACLYCIYLVFDLDKMHKRILFFFVLLLVSVIIFVCSYVLVGIPVRDGLGGIMLHAKAAVAGYRLELSFEQSLNYYKTWIIFGFLAFIQLSLYIVGFLRNKIKSWPDKLVLLLTFSTFIFLAYYFGGRFASQHYNLYAFLPIYQLFALEFAINPSNKKFGLPRKLWLTILLLASFIALLQPLQIIFLYPYYQVSGSTYTNMKSKYETIDTGGCHVVYTVGVAMLDSNQVGSLYEPDDLSGIVPTERMKREAYKDTCVVAFVQEVNSYARTPRDMQLIADFNDRSRYTNILKSLRLLKSPKGYSFSVYRGKVKLPS